MPILRSVVLNTLCPAVETDPESFVRALELFRGTMVRSVEYYAAGTNLARYRSECERFGLRSVFLAALIQKRMGQDLCAISEKARKEAVRTCLYMMKQAIQAGADALLITSGRKPANGTAYAMNALQRSLEEICSAAAGRLEIYLEPGDTNIDACQLVGPTDLACCLAAQSGNNLFLTMDLSHTAQLGEDPVSAFTMAAPYAKHFHLANCILQRGSSLYGDKHPDFGVPDGCFTSEDAQRIFTHLEALAAEQEIRVGMEIIDRSGDPWGKIQRIVQRENWFFRLGGGKI